MEMRARGLYWEQWLILIAAAVALGAAIDWGVPNKNRMTCLVGERPLTVQQQIRLTSVREQWRAITHTRRAREAKGLLHGEKTPHYDAPLEFGPMVTEAERLADFHSFVVSPPDPDERKTFGALAQMNPREWDFDPKTWYAYGGVYLYPVGFLLYTAQAAGLITVTQDVMFYVRRPESIALMYSIGRLLSLAPFLGTLFLIAKLGRRIGGRLAGTAAMLAFALSTLPLFQAVVAKPHMLAAFCAILSVYMLMNHIERPSLCGLLLSAAAAGCACGASIVAGAIGLLFPFLLLDRNAMRKSVFEILMCWAVMGAVFLLSNPYAALKPERYLLDFAGIGFFSSYNFLVASAGKMGSYFQEIFMKSYLVPISLLAVPGMIHAVVRESGFIARLAAGTLFIFLLMSVTVNNARITLFIGPPLCLFSGYALHISAHYLRNAAIHWKAIPLVALFIPGVFFAGLSIRDLASHDHWFAPTMAWIRSERISEGASIGVFERPAPTGTPPYPFVNAKLVNLNEKVAAYTPDYVILGFYENARRWETHPLRPKYEPTFDLGLRSSYTWFGNLRTRPPVTAAMVYKLRVNQSRRP